MYEKDDLCGISKSTFEIPHKNISPIQWKIRSVQMSKVLTQIYELVCVFETPQLWWEFSANLDYVTLLEKNAENAFEKLWVISGH